MNVKDFVTNDPPMQSPLRLDRGQNRGKKKKKVH